MGRSIPRLFSLGGIHLGFAMSSVSLHIGWWLVSTVLGFGIMDHWRVLKFHALHRPMPFGMTKCAAGKCCPFKAVVVHINLCFRCLTLIFRL